MDVFQNLVEILGKYYFVILPVCLIGMYWSKKRLDGIRSAEWLAANQFEPAALEDFEEIIEFAATKGKQDRVIKLFTKIKFQLGHSNLKIGHVIWLSIEGLDGNTPIEQLEIPTFVSKIKE